MHPQKFIVPLINSAVSGSISNYEINSLVKLTHQFAVIRLSQIVRSKKIVFKILPHAISTIALDSIAEIFHRDEEGNFIELNQYFTGDRDLKTTNELETFINYRRLVFSKMHDSVFRIYHEYDPITSKILRNLKIIVKRSPNIYSITRFGEVYYTLTPKDLNETENEMPPETLESELILVHTTPDSLETIFLKLLKIICEAERHRHFYSLIDLALIIKNVYMCNKNLLLSNLDIDRDMISTDVAQIVNESLLEIERELANKYLANYKIANDLFANYLRAVSSLIENTYIKNDGVELSHFDYLKEVKSDLSYEEYRKKHRAVFEYFVKISKSIVVKNLKEAFE